MMPQKPMYLLAVTPLFPSPHLLAVLNILFVSVTLPTLNISYRWDHTEGGFLCLPSKT